MHKYMNDAQIIIEECVLENGVNKFYIICCTVYVTAFFFNIKTNKPL